MNDKTEVLKNEERIINITPLLVYLLVFETVLVMGLISDYFMMRERGPLVAKNDLKEQIYKVVKHGGGFEVVKHVYDSRSKEQHSSLFRNDADKYYLYNVPLSFILDDLRKDFFSVDSLLKDTLYFDNLIHVIEENNSHNPFDNLNESQIFYFENIKEKSGDEYGIIQADIVKIADELYNKNQLVDRYLARSTTSFWISISALIVTIFLSLFQIFQNAKMIKRTISKHLLVQSTPDEKSSIINENDDSSPSI